VLVLQLAFDDVTENFRVLMRMLAKALACFHHVVVDHAQRAIAHVVGIEIAAKGERVPAVQPAEFRPAARGGRALHEGRFAACHWIHCGRFHDASIVSPPRTAQCFLSWLAMRFSYTCDDMELRHLRYFVTVAEEMNISRAS